MSKKKKYACTISGFIDYDENEGVEFNNLEETLKNIPKIFPSITAKKIYNQDGYGLKLTSDNYDDLKHAYIRICCANNGEAKYQKLVANNQLEDELESLGFYELDYE